MVQSVGIELKLYEREQLDSAASRVAFVASMGTYNSCPLVQPLFDGELEKV